MCCTWKALSPSPGPEAFEDILREMDEEAQAGRGYFAFDSPPSSPPELYESDESDESEDSDDSTYIDSEVCVLVMMCIDTYLVCAMHCRTKKR